MQSVIVIPAYQPTTDLLHLIQQLLELKSEQQIIIVNDGSSANAKSIFQQLVQIPHVKVLYHAINLGKGQALKTAFNYFLVNYGPEYVGVVTADADGQHLPADILEVAARLEQNSDTLWLGSRQLNSKVPWRSRFGNNLTRKIFSLFAGAAVHDTQTGLRGIPRTLLPELLAITASGYDFELDMLLVATHAKMPLQEVTIQTIYIDGNKSSHFNPLLDSLKIYFVFLRYSVVAIASAAIDFLLFSLSYFICGKILPSVVIARLLSGTFNFLMCKKMIFKSKGKACYEAIKYIALALFVLIASYWVLIALVTLLHVNVYLSKIIADVSIFLFSFAVQRLLIFHKHR
jgi:glycosyltransferase involved in cell wall biosynthesis